MATLREIRQRIGGIKNTQKITKAMKMVAAAKLRRAQDAVIAARPYARTMKDLLQHIAARVDITSHPLFIERPVNGVAVVVVTGDRGLCGGFNTNIVRAATTHIQDQYRQLLQDEKVFLICIGRKGADYFRANRYPNVSKYQGLSAGLTFEMVMSIASEIVIGFLNGKFDRVDVVYNEFKSIMHQRVVTEQMLPIPPSAVEATSLHPKSQIDYIFEPTKDDILSDLAPKHINFQLWHILLESNAAEQGARMTAMDNATSNATDLIRDLQLSYNKARQASITKELLEIVSGAEALKNAG